MFRLLPIVSPLVDTNALAQCADLTEIDKKSSKPAEKLSLLASSLYGLNPTKHWLSLTFAFWLDPAVVDQIVNSGELKIAQTYGNRLVTGFMSGSLADYERVVRLMCCKHSDRHLREVGNWLFNYLNNEFKLFSDCQTQTLKDKTFCLVQK